MPNNVFTALIQMLSTVSVRGEADIKTMGGVFQILRGMEQAANAPEEPEEAEHGG